MNSTIHKKLFLALIGLCLLGVGMFYLHLSKELVTSERDSSAPRTASEPEPGALTGENAAKADNPTIPQDPFKAFLEAKSKGSPVSATPSSDSTFVPGTDPFKAKLEEQKNAAHSAISPFKN